MAADRDIPEEMVEAATVAIGTVADEADRETFARTYAVAALSAALAGRQVVDLPEPSGVDENGDTYWKYPGGKAWSRANGRFDEKTAARFRAMAGALLAAVAHNERTHRAAGSGSGEG